MPGATDATPLLPRLGTSGNSDSWRRPRQIIVAVALLVGIACVSASVRLFGRPLEPGLPALESSSVGNGSPPHIVLMFTDDQGWNDIGYQSSDLFDCTPHLDELAGTGVKLTSYYTQPTCTPARGSLMTGKYPIHLGLQHSTIDSTAPWALPKREIILPAMMKQVSNYSTHILGKWHLGHFKEEYLPHRRGFDSFFGFYSSAVSYDSHIAELGRCANPNCFVDFHSNSEPVPEQMYTTYMLDGQARRIIRNHDQSRPLFLYYAIPNPHSPLMAPDEVFERHATTLNRIGNTQRRIFAAMTILLDDAARNLTDTLIEADMWKNTLFIYASDNGGAPVIYGAGSNFPLRGKKSFLFEGGVRVNAFIHSPLLPSSLSGKTFDGLVHVSDWVPTIVEGVLGRPDVLGAAGHLDGVNQWPAITGLGLDNSSEISPREEILLNIDSLGPSGKTQGFITAAIRHKNYKLIVNEFNVTTWPVPTTDQVRHFSAELVMGSFLYDIDEDPFETTNLFDQYPDVVARLMERISSHNRTQDDSEYCSDDPAHANDAFRRTGFVGPWVEDDAFAHCHSKNQDASERLSDGQKKEHLARS